MASPAKTSKRTAGWEGATALETRPSTRGIKTTSWDQLGQRNDKVRAQEKAKNQKKTRPLGSFYLFPSTDPLTSKQRQEIRAVNENISWVNRALRIMVAVVTGWGYTISVEPREEDEQLQDEALDAWKKKQRYDVPGLDVDEMEAVEDNSWTGGMSVIELEKWMMDYSVALDLQSHISRSYRYTLEQGQCGIAMLPETRMDEEGNPDDNGEYILPEVLRTIRPEHNVKIWLDVDTGEL